MHIIFALRRINIYKKFALFKIKIKTIPNYIISIKHHYPKTYKILVKNPYAFYKTLYNYLKIKIVDYYVIFKLERELAASRSLEDKISYIENYKALFYSKATAKLFLNIFRYSLEKTKQSVHLGRNANKIYMLHLCVWGDDYTIKMLRILVPSLLARGNLPAMATQYDIHIMIHCDQKSMHQLKNASIMQELSKYSIIQYEEVPSEIFCSLKSANANILSKVLSKLTNIRPNWKYYLLGSLQNIAMLIAQQNKAYISFLMPDLLFSNNALTQLFASIADGKKSAVATAFRSLDYEVEKNINQFYNNYTLDIPGKELTNIAVKTMHLAAQNRIVATTNAKFQLTAQMIFHYPQELVIRALHYQPVLVDFNVIQSSIEFDYNPIDSTFLCKIVDYNDDLNSQIWVNENSHEIGIMEISSAGIEPPGRVSKSFDLISSVQNLVKSNHWSDLNRYLVKKRCIYRYEGKYNYIISDLYDIDLISH